MITVALCRLNQMFDAASPWTSDLSSFSLNDFIEVCMFKQEPLGARNLSPTVSSGGVIGPVSLVFVKTTSRGHDTELILFLIILVARSEQAQNCRINVGASSKRSLFGDPPHA